MERWIYDEEHEQFRASIAAWLEAEIVPKYDEWERAGIVPREIWRAGGAQGFLGMDVAAEHGGGGAPDWRFNAVLNEAFGAAGTPGLAFALHNDVVIPYFTRLGTSEQQERWLPGMVRGELIGAIAMSEPGAGSDLASIATTAKDAGDHWVLNGSKTFISNGILADVVIVVARTGDEAGHGSLSLLVVERGAAGFERGRNLDKIGMHAQDTAELHFTDVRIPKDHLLGTQGRAFHHLMEGLAQERLVVAVGGYAGTNEIMKDLIGRSMGF